MIGFAVVVFILAVVAVRPPVALAERDEPLTVYVVNYPLQYFAGRVGAELVDVHFPAPAEVDPANWMPEDEVIQRYQQADLIFLNGADYARWVDHATLPDDRTVNTAAWFVDRFIEIEDAITHAHGGQGLHTHAGIASRTWLDPQLAIGHARAIKRALVERLPDHAAAIEQRFEALQEELEAFDKAMDALFDDKRDQPLLTSHPVYQYLGARYRLNLADLDWEPTEMPDDAGWQELDKLLADHPAQFILWEDTPLDETRERLQERGITSIVYDKCRQPPGEGDFLTVMWQNLDRLKVAFSGAEPE